MLAQTVGGCSVVGGVYIRSVLGVTRVGVTVSREIRECSGVISGSPVLG